MQKEMIFSLLLAVGVVGGGIWVADSSLTASMAARNVQQKLSANPGIVVTTPAPERPSTSSSGISKCLQNGQTTYSNDGCPVGAKHQQVVLYDTAGIEDKSKEQLAIILANSRPTVRAEPLVIQHVTHRNTASSADKKWECEQLKKQIAGVDAQARQPQSASSQDRLRAQKKELRDRYARLRC